MFPSLLAPTDGVRTSSTSPPGASASPSGTTPTTSSAAASRPVWDRLDEQQRREALEAMQPDAVRSFAASMPVIEQAKGVLMGCYGGDAAAAFSILVRLSSVKNVKLRDLAADVVEAASSQTCSAGGSALSPSERVGRLLQVGDDGRHQRCTSGRRHRS